MFAYFNFLFVFLVKKSSNKEHENIKSFAITALLMSGMTLDHYA